MSTLKMGSFNVRDLGDSLKRRKLCNYLHDNDYDVIFLQETHCTKKMEKMWRNEWGGDAFFANYNSKSRGVAIPLNKKKKKKN